MTRSRRRLYGFGALGLLAGLLLLIAAPLAGTGLDGLLRGYGLLLATSAGYMLVGLGLLGVRGRRPARTRHRITGETVRHV